MARKNASQALVLRNVLILLRLLNADGAIHYSSGVSTTRWGDAIARLLAERGWSKRQLADAASVRPNTVTNLITHGRDSDTATLARIAAALKVDIAELFLTREQSLILQAHKESRVERLRDAVLKELSETVTRLVTRELEKAGELPAIGPTTELERGQTKRGKKRSRPGRQS